MTSQLGRMNKEEKLDHIEDCKVLIDEQSFYGRLCLAAAEDTDAADEDKDQCFVSSVWVS